MVVCRANLDEICGVAEWAVKFRADVNLTKLFPYMEHLNPLALRKSDAAALQEQIRRATQLCGEHGLCLTHSVYVDDSPDDNRPIDKEQLLAALEGIEVTQGLPIGDLEESCAVLEKHGYDYLPAPLMEAGVTAPPLAAPPFPASPTKTSGRAAAMDAADMTRRYKRLSRQVKRLRSEEIRIPYCLSPWMRLYVESSSFLRPCCVWPGHFADLKDSDSLQDALSGEEFVQLRRKMLHGTALPKPCRNCSFAERYHGLPEFLAFLVMHRRDITRLRLPPNFFPPDEVKTMLSSFFCRWSVVARRVLREIGLTRRRRDVDAPAPLGATLRVRFTVWIYRDPQAFTSYNGPRNGCLRYGPPSAGPSRES